MWWVWDSWIKGDKKKFDWVHKGLRGSKKFKIRERHIRLLVQYFLLLLQVLTKDSVTVSVDAVVYYRVSNATVSVANVENAHHSTRLLAQTTLRNILGTKNLHEILSDRESISGSMQVLLQIFFMTTFKGH